MDKVGLDFRSPNGSTWALAVTKSGTIECDDAITLPPFRRERDWSHGPAEVLTDAVRCGARAAGNPARALKRVQLASVACLLGLGSTGAAAQARGLDRCIIDAGYRGHNAPRSQVQGSYHRARSAAQRRRSDANSNGRPPSSSSSQTSREHHRMGRSHLANAILAVAGHNFRRLLAWLTFLWVGILIAHGLPAQLKSA
jgi:hypothetical protein